MAVIQPTGRLAISVHTAMVLTSFGLEWPANKHERCSPSNVTSSHQDCQTYFISQLSDVFHFSNYCSGSYLFILYFFPVQTSANLAVILDPAATLLW